MIIDKPNAQQLPSLHRLWQQAFGDSALFVENFFRTGFSPDRCRCLTLNSQPVAALYWFDCVWQDKKLAYMYAVATEEVHRGQGLCRKLMENTHSHLQANGYHGAVLVPGTPALAAMYQNLGYTPFLFADTVSIFANGPACPANKISAEQFGHLRKTFLPENAVIHEKETYAFLDTFCEFFLGEDFLLCAAREDGTLHVQEFLGKEQTLPGILTAMQLEKAVIRIPGSNIFAMYRSFTEDNQLPGYFGIALD